MYVGGSLENLGPSTFRSLKYTHLTSSVRIYGVCTLIDTAQGLSCQISCLDSIELMHAFIIQQQHLYSTYTTRHSSTEQLTLSSSCTLKRGQTIQRVFHRRR